MARIYDTYDFEPDAPIAYQWEEPAPKPADSVFDLAHLEAMAAHLRQQSPFYPMGTITATTSPPDQYIRIFTAASTSTTTYTTGATYTTAKIGG